jgi:hypothetical protein
MGFEFSRQLVGNNWGMGRVEFFGNFFNFENFVAGKQQCLGKNFKLNGSSGKGRGENFGVARRF